MCDKMFTGCECYQITFIITPISAFWYHMMIFSIHIPRYRSVF